MEIEIFGGPAPEESAPLELLTASEIEAERKGFKADRLGHNNAGLRPHISRITHLCHAKGWVMARRPGCTPFVISEKLWRSFPLYECPIPSRKETR